MVTTEVIFLCNLPRISQNVFQYWIRAKVPTPVTQHFLVPFIIVLNIVFLQLVLLSYHKFFIDFFFTWL